MHLSVDGLGGNLALCGGAKCGHGPSHRGGLLHDDGHLPHTEVHFLFLPAATWIETLVLEFNQGLASYLMILQGRLFGARTCKQHRDL